jgi:ATP-dependent protease ClpP protease subunit
MKIPWFQIRRSGNRAIVSIFGEIIGDREELAEFERELEGVQAIELFVDSIGGDAITGVKVHGILAGRCEVATVTGRAYSSAIPIICAAKHVQCWPDTRLMVHAPCRFAYCTADQLRLEADDLQSTEDSFVDIIAARIKSPVSTVRKWMTGDHYFDAEQAHAIGLVDSIVERPETPAEVETVAVTGGDEAATARTESEALLFELLNAVGRVQVVDRERFGRELGAWLACNVKTICE